MDNKFISYCGLNCETCEARLATINNDDVLRAKVAEKWSKMNGITITSDQINCEGCRIDGVKSPFCDKLCPIRQCALKKNYNTCGDCNNLKTCKKVSMIIDHNDHALDNLTKNIEKISKEK